VAHQSLPAKRQAAPSFQLGNRLRVVLLRRDYDGFLGAAYPDCKVGMEILGMKSGFHKHRCPRCGISDVCAQITHCKRPYESVCVDCEESVRDLDGMIEHVNKELDKE